MKKSRKFVSFMLNILLAAALIMPLCDIRGHAAGNTAAIEVPQNISVGDTFTVTASFSADSNIGSVKATIDYNSDVIEFVSGDYANGGGGLCIINGWAESAGSTLTFKLTFKAVGEGTSQLLITRSLVYSENGDLLGSPVEAGTVTVVAKGSVTTAKTTSSVTETTTVTVTTAEITSSLTDSQTTPSQTTTTINTAATTTTPITKKPEGESSGKPGGEGDPDEPGAATAVTKTDDESSESDASGEVSKRDTKGAVTVILLVIGAVVIVCIIMSGDSGGNRGSRSSGKRKRSSRSSRR